MATLLDLGLLEGLTPIFVGLFVFIILYAIFQKLKIFGESAGAGALIAAIFALLFTIVADLRELITFFVPWVAVFFVLLIVILMAVMLLGFTQKEIIGYLTDNPGVTTAIVIIVIIIFFIALNQVFPGSIGYPSGGKTGLGVDVRRIIFHPRVLGVILVLVITSFVVKYIGYPR